MRSEPLQATRLGGRYAFLDHWRGVACLSVIFFHSAMYAIRDNHVSWGDPSSWAIAIVERLWIGVPIFFVISGYCIAATADKNRSRGVRWDFFWRRFRRIFPPYWICLALSIIAVLLGERLSPGLFSDNVHPLDPPWKYGFLAWIGNVTLTEAWRSHFIGAPGPFFLGHAWTLGLEEQFYAVTGVILVLFSKRFFRGIAIVTLLSLMLDRMSYYFRWNLDGFFFNDGRWLQFAAGVAVYYCVHHATPARRRILTLILFAGVVYAAHSPRILLQPTAGTRQYLFASAGFALLILWMHPFDQKLTDYWLLRPLQICGTMCYSLYLVHWPIAKGIAHAAYLSGIRSNAATLLITIPISLLSSLAVASIFHALVERRFLNSPARSTVSGSKTVPSIPPPRLAPSVFGDYYAAATSPPVPSEA